MKERGQALLALIALLGLVMTITLFTFLSPSQTRIKAEAETQKIMVEAKNALIGFAATRGYDPSRPGSRPGQLPCPDTNNDGLAEAPNSTGCPSGNIGRLPWKTLGIDDIRDDAGERLWYAIDPDFARESTACCFDNDTRGMLTVYQGTKATKITSEAAAIIFAPGPPLGGQNRDLANQNNPASYLDTTDTVNNAAGTQTPPPSPLVLTFIAAQNSDTLPPSPPPSPFNDRLMIVYAPDIWTVVEMRVAREMLKYLQRFKLNSDCNCYPWAANFFDDDGVANRRHGGVPIEEANVGGDDEWGGDGNGPLGSKKIPDPSAAGEAPWMVNNNEWGKQFYYAIADRVKPGGNPASTSLFVDGVAKDLVIITPGPTGAICREYTDPATYTPPHPPSIGCQTGYRSNSRQLNLYIEVVPGAAVLDENRNLNDTFITTSPAQGYARDRVYFCPGTPGIC